MANSPPKQSYIHGLYWLPPFQGAVGSSCRTRVYVKLIFILKCLELVCVPRDKDVNVELSLEECQAGHVAPGDHLMAVDESNLKLAHCDHLLLWVVQVLRKYQENK